MEPFNIFYKIFGTGDFVNFGRTHVVLESLNISRKNPGTERMGADSAEKSFYSAIKTTSVTKFHSNTERLLFS